MALVIFDKNAAGPVFSSGAPTSLQFGPYFAGDVVDLAAGSITKLNADHAIHTAPTTVTKATRHTADY
jgi:hypothetical protein